MSLWPTASPRHIQTEPATLVDDTFAAVRRPRLTLRTFVDAERPVTPLKATELYRLARRELGPELTSLGFKPLPKSRVAAWYRADGDRWLIMAFESDPWNYPNRGGYRFTIGFRLSPDLQRWDTSPTDRFTVLLSARAREELRCLENATIAHLPPPGPDAYLADWSLIPEPYRSNEDVWFRQASQADVLALMHFIRENVASAVETFVVAARVTLAEDPTARRARLAEAREAALKDLMDAGLVRAHDIRER